MTQDAKTQQDYIDVVGSETAAIEFEHQTLSIGREFLPACAVQVLDGGLATAEYWQWLTEQVEKQESR
jgi:hypothetical protein